LFASLSKIQDDKVRMRRAYLRALSVTLVLASLVSAFVIVNAEVIVRILLGPAWLGAVPLVQSLFAAFAARSGYMVAESVPLALGLGGQAALRQGAQLSLVVAGALIGAEFGIVGAAIGVATGYWLFYLLCLVLARRLLDVDWPAILRLHANAVLIALPPVVLALGVRWLLPGDALLLQLISPAAFGLAALAVVWFSPPSLVGEDVIRGRNHVWERLSRRLTRLRIRL
jgi:PST family polysaccharide transporter